MPLAAWASAWTSLFVCLGSLQCLRADGAGEAGPATAGLSADFSSSAVPDDSLVKPVGAHERKLQSRLQPSLWEWPERVSLRLGGGEPAYTVAVVKAGLPYSSLEISLPLPPCTSVVQSSTAVSTLLHHVVAHVHDEARLDVLVRVRGASPPSHLFLGPSLAEGYEVTLGNATVQSMIRRGSLSTTYDGDLLPADGNWETLWAAFSISAGRALLRLGFGAVLGSREILSLMDATPPPAILSDVYMWLVHSSGEWEVCPASREAAVLTAAQHPAPMLKALRAGAAEVTCRHGGGEVPVLATHAHWPLSLAMSEGKLSSNATFAFMHGGENRLCYKPDAQNFCVCRATGDCECEPGGGTCTASSSPYGTCDPFNDPQTSYRSVLLPVQLLILGVSSSCTTDGCLERERWDCYFVPLREGRSFCVIDLSPETGRFGWSLTPGRTSRMTWTATYGLDAQVGGVLQQTDPRPCGENDHASFNFDVPASADAITSVELLPTTLGAVELPGVRASVLEPFSVGVCYCPEVALQLDSVPCRRREDFVQAFGVLYMWTMSICDYDDLPACYSPYLRVVPQQKFSVKLKCPPGGACAPGDDNRIKMLEARAGSGLRRANWDAGAACKTVHAETSHAIWPDPADTLSVSGGRRIDYKVWGEKQVLLDQTLGASFEVCYCNVDCSTPSNWIEVGSVRTAHAFALAARTQDTAVPNTMRTVEFVNKPGSFTLYAGIRTPSWQAEPSPYDSNKFSGFAILYFLSFDREEVRGGGLLAEKYGDLGGGLTELQGSMDQECRREAISPSLVEGLASRADIFQHMAFSTTAGSAATTGRFLAFAGAGKDRTLVARKAGTLAACYCGRATTAGFCLTPDHWLFAGLVQIKGPRGGQTWTLPTRTVVRIAGVQGWGFDVADKFRLLDTGAICSFNNFLPSGSTWFKLGCPSGSASAPSCQQATTTEVVASSLADSTSTGIRIVSIHIESSKSSVLTFSGPITEHLQDGDGITIDPESVGVAGRTVGQLNDLQRYAVFKLSGEAPFQDDPTIHFLHYWHKVSLVGRQAAPASAPAADPSTTKLRIPIGWDRNSPGGIPTFSFSAAAASASRPQWVRRNVIGTGYELKVMQPRKSMPLCWSALDDGVQKSYAHAGEVTFEDPGPMSTASFSLTTRQAGAMAPAVISFSINPMKQVYEGVQGEMVLTLRFLQNSKVAVASGMSVLDGAESLPVSGMSQVACGRLFLELWANDAHGFPVPKGCYYTALGSTGEPTERELHVVFDRFNGLRNICRSFRSICNYQLVVNAVAVGLNRWDRVLEIYTGCRFEGGGCRSEFEIYEKGEAELNRGTLTAAGPGDARLAAGSGFQLLDVDADGVHHLNASAGASIQARLVAAGPQGIQRGSLLRLFLVPLTQWDAGPAACQASCTLANPVFTCEGAEDPVLCSKDQVVPATSALPQKLNLLRLVLPSQMDVILGAVAPTIRLAGLALPTAALFPTRLGVELASPSDLAPHYQQTGAAVAFLGEGSPATDGRFLLVGRTGGGPQPFQGERNVLVARLRFAASLWTGRAAVGTVTAFVDILPPVGYTCQVHGTGAVPHSFVGGAGSEAWLGYALERRRDAPYGNSPERLFLLDRDMDDQVDFPRGTLSVKGTDGSWDASLGKRGCSYELRAGQAVHAGQVVYVQLSLENPSTPMQRSSTVNAWAARLRAAGALHPTLIYSTREDAFIPLSQERSLPPQEQDLWAGSAAVLGPLHGALVQPSNFGPGELHVLSIFFGTVQDVGYGGEVIVDAPLSFTFNETCAIGDLAGLHYERNDPTARQLPLGPVMPLPRAGACRGEPTPDARGVGTNRARVRVHGRLGRGRTYGFQLWVTNPGQAAATSNSTWYVFTADAAGLWVDGSKDPASFAPGLRGESWRLYSQSWPGPPELLVQSGLLRPSRIFREPSVLVVQQLRALDPRQLGAVVTSLRVTAPPSCRFSDPASGGVLLTAPRSSAPLPHGPQLGSPAQLLWPSLTLREGEVYGFQAPLEVMEEAPQGSLHAFFLELGYASASLEDRLGAVTVAAPALARLVAAPVDYLTSQLGFSRNVLVFRLRLASGVPTGRGAALEIRGGEGLRGSRLACRPTALGGESLPLPLDLGCKAGSDAVGAPYLLLLPVSVPLEPGFYALEVQASNPPVAPSVGSVDWTVSTFYDAADPFARTPIDAPALAVGFPLRRSALSASIVSKADGDARDDRPGRNNSVVISFVLDSHQQAEQPEVSLLRIRAPWGFTFQEACLPGLATSRAEVFEGVPGRDQHEDWPAAQAPTSCEGSGRAASILVPRGLLVGKRYALRVSVLNPEQPPSRNVWALEYDSATSELIEGFPLALVSFPMPISAVNVAAGLPVEAPVTLVFLLQHAVPPGGELRVTAPPGFGLRNATALRPHNAGLSRLQSLAAPVSAFDGTLLTVQVGTSGLDPLMPWALEILTMNPSSWSSTPGSWSISSANASVAGAPLDEGHLPGYGLHQAASLVVENVGGHYSGLEPVTIFVTVISPVQWAFGDTIHVVAPLGLQLASDIQHVEGDGLPTKNCSGFMWLQWLARSPRPVPSCACSFGPCELLLALQQGETYTAGWPLVFRLSSANPAREPPLAQAFWRVTHVRGAEGVLAAAAQRSWRVRPRLAEASVLLVGSNQAAGAESTLLVAFVPIGAADYAWLVAEHPREVSFDGADVEAPRRKDSRSGGPNLIVAGLGVVGGAETSILVAHVRLGRGGGRSVFSLMTYATAELRETVDELLHFDAFYQPGRATLQGTLRSSYAIEPDLYPARSLLPARGFEEAQATFRATFSHAVMPGDRLVLRCEGDGAFELLVDARFVITRLKEAKAGFEREPVEAETTPHGSHSAEALLLGVGSSSASGPGVAVFEPGRQVEVIIWVVPTLSINSWRIETLQDRLLTNTNDGVSTGFQPVAPLKVLLQAQRSPPRTLVQVQLQATAAEGVLEGAGAVVPEVLLVAPLGFRFPPDCGNLCAPLPDTFGSTGRATAVLRSPGTGTLIGTELSFRTETPVLTPVRLEWIVQARGVDGQVTGWGFVEGFQVHQMPETSVLYGGIQGLSRAQVVFQFTFTAEPGTRQLSIIEATAPVAFLLSCQPGSLRRISLPGAAQPSCERDGYGQLRLRLGATLRPGPYAFAAEATLPAETPNPNTFTVVVRDLATESVADAAFDVPGWPLIHFAVAQPNLAWSTVGLGERSSVTVGFALENVTDQLRVLVINLPPGFKQMVRTPSDVKSSNTKLPLLKGSQDWIDTSSASRLRVLLETSDPTVAAGGYRLTFPVDLPENTRSISPLNIWHFDLCTDRSCLDPRSPSSLVSFPMAGFMPGEVSVLEEKRKAVAMGSLNVIASSARRPPRLVLLSPLRWAVLAAVLMTGIG